MGSIPPTDMTIPAGPTWQTTQTPAPAQREALFASLQRPAFANVLALQLRLTMAPAKSRLPIPTTGSVERSFSARQRRPYVRTNRGAAAPASDRHGAYRGFGGRHQLPNRIVISLMSHHRHLRPRRQRMAADDDRPAASPVRHRLAHLHLPRTHRRRRLLLPPPAPARRWS
jgi:hypothetical protein